MLPLNNFVLGIRSTSQDFVNYFKRQMLQKYSFFVSHPIQSGGSAALSNHPLLLPKPLRLAKAERRFA